MKKFLSSPEVNDPLGHIKLSVVNFARSAEFYGSLFQQLGYVQISDKEMSAGWSTPEGFGIWIAQAELDVAPLGHGAPGFHHLCMKVESPEQVDALYAHLVEAEAHIFNPPQSYTQYTKSYYAVFFADPDGMKLEVAYY